MTTALPPGDHSDPFEELARLLAQVAPDAMSQLRLLIVREDPTIDADCKILAAVYEKFRPILVSVLRELDEANQRRQKEVAITTGVENVQEWIPTQLTRVSIAAPLLAGMNESLRLFNGQAREAAARAGRKVTEIETKYVELEIRAYFLLWGLPRRASPDLEAWYNKQPKFVQDIIARASANVLADLINFIAAGTTMYLVLS